MAVDIAIEAAGTVQCVGGTEWASRYHVGEGARILLITHASVIRRGRTEDPIRMMDTFLRRTESNATASLSEVVARASKDARSISCPDDDPLTRTSLTALVFGGSSVAVANIGDNRGYVIRFGNIASLAPGETFHQLTPGDAFLLCNSSLARFVSPETIVRAVARRRNAERTLDTIATFVPRDMRFTAILARVRSLTST